MSDDFRKNMHVAYKRKISDILLEYTRYMIDNIEEFDNNPKNFIEKWVDSRCLPMGDFSKDEAIKEIEEWQK